MFVVVLAALVAFGWWIWEYSRSQALRLPLSVGVAFDISGSMQKDEKQRAIDVLNSMFDTIVPSKTPTRLWVYAEKIYESMDIRPTDSSDPSLNAFAERIKKPLGKKDTYQKLPLQALLDYAKAQPDRTVVLCLFTDGEDHTPEETRRLAEQIRKQPNVCAVLVGPLEEQFKDDLDGMRKRLGALDRSGKLILFGMNDARNALDKLREKLVQRNKEVRQ
jgi:hypothetical protein